MRPLTPAAVLVLWSLVMLFWMAGARLPNAKKLGVDLSDLTHLQAFHQRMSADAGVQPFVHGGIGTIEVGFPKGGDAKQAQGYLDGVIAGVLKNGVSAELVEAAKRQEKAQFEFAKNSPFPEPESIFEDVYWEVDNKTDSGQSGRHFFND